MVEKRHSELITYPPGYFRGMAHAVSIDSQIKLIRDSVSAGHKQPSSLRRQVTQNAIDHG